MSSEVRSVGEKSGRSLVSNVRIIGGSIYGIIAWGVGFVAVAGLFLDRVQTDALNFQEEGFDMFVDFLAWVFYGSHTVDTQISAAGRSQTMNVFQEFVIRDTTLFHAVPAVLLFVSGYIVATRVPRDLDAVEGAVAGASVAVGYAVVTFVGVSYFSHTTGGVTYGPPMVNSMLFMGVGYPVLFGGAGGLLKGM